MVGAHVLDAPPTARIEAAVPGPLDGIRVLDLSRNAPGPFCTMILGDLGADVLQVVDPRPPDGRRAEQAGAAPARAAFAWRGTAHDAIGRNKRSIGLNLKDVRAQELFRRLAQDADVVVEEMRPGVTARLGVDYETLRRRNPRLVYCSVTGYGQTGPYASLPGHDVNYLGQAGLLGIVGDGEHPVIPQNVVADYAGGGLLAAMGVIAALYARERSGQGQHVDAAMTDGVTYLLAQFVSAFYGSGEQPRFGGTMFTGELPQYGAYECADGRWLTVGSLEPWFYANLCRALGREDLIPHAWDTERHPQIRAELATQFRTRPRDEWVEELNRTDQCAGRVLALEELEHAPQVQARGMIVEVPGPGGPAKQVGIAPKLSGTPGSIRRIAPRPCEHTDEVLAELGLSPDEIAELRRGAAVG
jgi:crotonobetainyl-CoA:carnitine CoA-transferase CaiB-like acyl-CoA transferase